MAIEESFPRRSISLLKNSLRCQTSVTPEKKYENPVDPSISPDLFIEEESFQKKIKEMVQPVHYIAEERYIIKKDHKILKRAHHSLKGVFPPLSVTVVQLSINEMLNRLESNKDYFWTNNCSEKKIDVDKKKVDNLNTSNESTVKDEPRSLLITGVLDNCVKKPWPTILEERYHGLQ
ncbi:hypothetical protein NQ314_012860 [Rhamnusium bicolor]|uniref:Uncharacterized protein n=1 Tax=Rhamnusium bicolor TaxID=1586634 RepID=A0AAV8XAC7_9CUCU|nr:hypothetical protein NQ314_012860 [Rhamnusium bicolor]